MSIYRVYLSLPTTSPPTWDYGKTVVATSPAEAMVQAHTDWSRRQSAPLPPLAQCHSQVIMIETRRLLGSTPRSSAQLAYLQMLEHQVNRLLRDPLDGRFRAITAAPGFHYGINNGQHYHHASLQDLDTLLAVAGNGQLSWSGERFSGLYSQILQAVNFAFSAQDQAILDQEATQATDEIAGVFAAQTSPGLPPDAPDALQQLFNQLAQRFGDPARLPDEQARLRQALAAYQVRAPGSYTLRRQSSLASARLHAARSHMRSPSASNGGLLLDTGAHGIGFDPSRLPSTQWLVEQLSHPQRSVRLTLRLSQRAGQMATVTLPGDMPFYMHSQDVLSLSINGAATTDLSCCILADSQVTIDICYAGITHFPVSPQALTADNTWGWYAQDILQDVLGNTSQALTSYRLDHPGFDLNYLFGQGLAFSRLQTLVISQPPRLILTCEGANTRYLAQALPAGAPVTLRLFNLLNLGSADASYVVQALEMDRQRAYARLILTAPLPCASLPPAQQLAHVLGGVAALPPEGI